MALRGRQRCGVLGAAIAVLFVATAAVLSRVIPGPHTPADYLIIGTSATLVSLALVFGAVALLK